jgi:hypothetical protein
MYFMKGQAMTAYHSFIKGAIIVFASRSMPKFTAQVTAQKGAANESHIIEAIRR